MIVNIRGTSGSGKSTLVRQVAQLENAQRINERIVRGRSRFDGYYNPIRGIRVVGPYTTECGGCDRVRTQDEICERVRILAALQPSAHVLFEGLLISDLFSRYRDLGQELEARGYRFIVAVLDTPLELCLERVRARRLARGNTKPFNPKNTTTKHRNIQRAAQKFRNAGIEVINLEYERAEIQLCELLGC